MQHMEKTLAIIKPDAVQRGIAGKLLDKLESNHLKIVAMKMVSLSKEQAKAFYQVHMDRPFFDSLTTYMSSGPIIALVIEGKEAIRNLRDLMGATDPSKAAEGTIRKEYGLNIEQNSIHGSDSPSTAQEEIPFFFNHFEILSC
jgi:nucleoside-diphosphate kinase